MNITSAQLTSAGTIDVQYGQNTTGRISGWSYTPTGNLVCGETYTFYFYPQFSGTVLTENFTISGVDEAGIPRSDTAVLRQGFDTDFRNYSLWSSAFYGMNVNSTAATENYFEVNATITDWDSNHTATIIIIPRKGVSLIAQWYVEDPTQPTGSVISSLEIVVADSITGTGQASAVYVSSSATVSLVYSSTDTSIATIDPDTGGITVLQDGTVTFCVQDRLSGLVDCKQVQVTTLQGFSVTYDVISTTDATFLMNPEGISGFTSARLANGTPVELGNEYYFPETGLQTVYYTLVNSTIPFRAFSASLKSRIVAVNLSSDITGIGEQAFYNGSITNLVIPSSVTAIGAVAFAQNPLTSLTLNEGLLSIGHGSFATTELTTVNLPNSLTSTGGLNGDSLANPFHTCPYLVSFTGKFASDNGRLLVNDGGAVSFAPYGLTEYDIPSYVTRLGYGLFMHSGLNSIRIPSTVTRIDTWAFEDCCCLTGLTIPASVTSFGNGIWDCYHSPNVMYSYEMQYIEFKGTTPPTYIGDYPLGNYSYNPWQTFPIYVPCQSLEAYRTAFPGYEERIVCSETPQTLATSITLNLNSTVTDYAVAACYYTPSDASVDIHYSIEGTTAATINEFTGEITVLDDGSGTVYVRDYNSGLYDGKLVTFAKTPDTGETGAITALTLSVADDIIASGVATPIYAPLDVPVSLYYTSSDTSKATIDQNGNITVLDNGLVTFCAMDRYSGLRDCKEVTVREAVYIDDIELHNTLVIGQEAADVTYTPSSATVSLVYSSSNPDIISVDSNGLMTVNDYGTADITVRDVYTNRSDVKTITGMKAIDPEPYKSNYLTFDILTGGTVTLKSGLETGITIDVRINGGSWSTKKPKSGSNVNITVSPGDKLEFRASRSKYNHTIFASSFCRFNVSGNIMSIVNKEPSSFSARTQFDETYVFRDLFAGCAGIVDASCLAMPITGLTTGCYERMFRNCTNMKVAPMLPATRFYGTSGSTSWSYRRMFEGCSSLFYVKCLLGPTYGNTGGVEDWLSGVASNGYFIKNSDGITSELNIPSSWTVIDAT